MSNFALREQLPYRPCVGVVLFNNQGKVFAAKRKPQDKEFSKYIWQLPQGGIDKGEVAAEAATRELYEETNIKSVELIERTKEPLFYDLPDDLLGIGLKGKYRGQVQDWFAMRFVGDESEINVKRPANGAHPAEFSEWAWKELAEMPDLIVPFKRKVYEDLLAMFSHIGPKETA